MQKQRKLRLDQALVERELVDSREKARRRIMAGEVRVNGHPASKPSQAVGSEDRLELTARERFVSRGGEKLQAALEHFKISVAGRVCLDVGASTGGFTDCLLQGGAKKVFCVDVGDNQLAWKLRSDPRVVCMEGVNARHLQPAQLPEPADFITADVSFISLEKILPAAAAAGKPDCQFAVLIKPQFEAGRQQVGKGGVVRDANVHAAVVERIRRFVVETMGLSWIGCIESPLKGPAGNKEFLAYFRRENR